MRLAAIVIGILSVCAQPVSAQTIPDLADQIKSLADQIKTLVPPPPPPPVDCVVSAFTLQSAEPWLPAVCPANGLKARTETWARTITTDPAHGGLACPVLTETRTATQACVYVPPPPTPSLCGNGVSGPLCGPSNTGLVGAGIAESSLTNQGSITYGSAYNGQTISGKRFTGSVMVTGQNIVFDGNLWDLPPSSGGFGLACSGSASFTLRNSTMRTSSGSVYRMARIWCAGPVTFDRVNISGAEDLLNTERPCANLLIDHSYFHHASNASNPGGHRDAMELYGCDGVIVRRSTIIHPVGETAAINIAPWSGSNYQNNTLIEDNYIDGGNFHFIVDLQSSGRITNTRILRNRLGGHLYNFGGATGCQPVNNADGRTRHETEAALAANPNGVLFPTGATNPDRNIWFYTQGSQWPFGYSNLGSNREGQTVTQFGGAIAC